MIWAFRELTELKDDVSDFFESTSKLASDFVNAVTGIDEVTTESLQKDLADLETQLKNTKAAQEDLAGTKFEGSLDERVASIQKEIKATKDRISVFQQADLADAKIDQAETNRRNANKSQN